TPITGSSGALTISTGTTRKPAAASSAVMRNPVPSFFIGRLYYDRNLTETKMSDETISAFRVVPRTGVIFVTTEAARLGFRSGDPDWCNLGQGQPETGPLPGAPPRVHDLTIAVGDQEYAPIPGLGELREAIAGLYNRLYRRGLPSQ